MPQPLYNITYPGAGKTLYAVVRQASGSYLVKRGAALEAWNDTNLADYAVALTDQGGDLYTAPDPTDLPVGLYTVRYYVRAGATPAITDLIAGGYTAQWNGASFVPPSGDVVLSPYALTTLADLKSFMGLDPEDATPDDKLTSIINATSAKIERITGRKFVARDYRRRFNGMRQVKLVLKNPPVQVVYGVAIGSGTAMSVSYNGTGLMANLSVYNDPESGTGGGVKLRTVSNLGIKTDTDLTFAAYPTTALLATAISAVTGWTATAALNLPSDQLDPLAGANAKSIPQALTYPLYNYEQYTVDSDRAILTLGNAWWSGFGRYGGDSVPYVDPKFPRKPQGILVSYRGGYETVPGDVAMVCQELVKNAYYASTRDGAANSEQIGPYSVSLTSGIAIGSNGVAAEEAYVRSKLAAYVDAGAYMGGSA